MRLFTLPLLGSLLLLPTFLVHPSVASAAAAAASTTNRQQQQEEDKHGTRVSDLQDMQQGMDQFLQRYVTTLETWRNSYNPLVTQLEDQHTNLLELESDLALRTAALQQKVQHVNARSLEYLAKLLNETVQMELQSRQQTNAQQQQQHQQPLVPLSGISESSMMEMIAGDVILDTAEAALKQWIVIVVEKDVMRARVAAAQQSSKPSNSTTTTTSTKCLTPSDGAQLVQESILQLKSKAASASASASGPLDRLKTATVVYELTSDTYTAPPTETDLLGHVTWRKHIPQDWEMRWLPKGWQQWNMAMPDTLLRSLVRLLLLCVRACVRVCV